MNYPAEIKIKERIFAVDYEIVRRLTSSVRIKKGGVYIKISRFAFGGQRDEIVAKFLKWAEKKLQKTSQATFIEPIYEDGGRVSTHNKIYEIAVFEQKRKTIRSKLSEGYLIEIYLPDDFTAREKQKQIKYLAEGMIMADQTPYLKEVLDELNQLYFDVNYAECRFKRMNSRFGSCSNRGNINMAYRLLFAPREVFRYVCAHELAHLKAFNHSRKFWEWVKTAIPDYKIQEKWLRHNGFMLG